MDFSPEGELFFADNKGGGNATEELNLLEVGKFYGHNPKKYEGKFEVTVPPVFSVEHELAPSGIELNPLKNGFGGTAGNLFVAFYGPSERWNRGGISRITIQKSNKGIQYQELPVADIPKLSDLAFGIDGSLYLAQHGISDYWYNPTEVKTGNFYKLIYDSGLEGKNPTKREIKAETILEASLENGKQLFAFRACSACHGVDGESDLIGPNLKGVGKEFSQAELLEEIMIATRITKKDGKVLLGRIVYSDSNQISIMLVGNQIVQVQKSEIERAEEEIKSLMYENLLAELSEDEIDDLLNYISSL